MSWWIRTAYFSTGDPLTEELCVLILIFIEFIVHDGHVRELEDPVQTAEGRPVRINWYFKA